MPTTDRRDFLRVTTATAAALTLPVLSTLRAATPRAKACILINMIGGPSQIDTFDPKPTAPTSIRSEFQTIRTAVPGIHISEMFPRMASIMDKIAIVRSVHHDAMPIHETGLQLLQTGHLARGATEFQHVGSIIDSQRPFMVMNPLGQLGVSVSHAQGSGTPIPSPSSYTVAPDYIDRGVRCIVINQFASVYDMTTWDCHASRGSLSSTLTDYISIGHEFDFQFTKLITTLEERGMLDETLVVAMGEMGRTPMRNDRGGRDHWTGVWSILFAGGGVNGGQVVGSSDADGAYPKDRPIDARMVPATILHAMGIDSQSHIPGVQPIHELFR